MGLNNIHMEPDEADKGNLEDVYLEPNEFDPESGENLLFELESNEIPRWFWVLVGGASLFTIILLLWVFIFRGGNSEPTSMPIVKIEAIKPREVVTPMVKEEKVVQLPPGRIMGAYNWKSSIGVVGSIFTVICIIVLSNGFARGWCTLLMVACINLLVVGYMYPPTGGQHAASSVLAKRTGWPACAFMSPSLETNKYMDHEVVHGLGTLMDGLGDSSYDDYYLLIYDSGNMERFSAYDDVLAMHVPKSARLNSAYDGFYNGFYISPWIFHPACLFWSPLLVILLSSFGWILK